MKSKRRPTGRTTGTYRGSTNRSGARRKPARAKTAPARKKTAQKRGVGSVPGFNVGALTPREGSILSGPDVAKNPSYYYGKDFSGTAPRRSSILRGVDVRTNPGYYYGDDMSGTAPKKKMKRNYRKTKRR